MSDTRDKIKNFLSDLEADEGLLPKFAHNLQGKSDQLFYSGPLFDHEELSAAIEALIMGKWLASGDHVARFERQFCKSINARHAVMVNSGSSANLIMLGALKAFYDWKDGDEVLVSAVGFPTTVAPVYQCRMSPVFLDIEWETLNFDLDQLASKITPKTRAVLLSPVLGNPPDMDRLQEICHKHSVRLVLDGCDSLGSYWEGKELSEYAVASSCSFYPAHHITTGEGGMVSSNEQELISIARSMAWWGRDCYCVGKANLLPKGSCGRRFDQWLEDQNVLLDHKYVFSHMGYNLKPLDLQGAVGLAQLKKLDSIHQARRENKIKVEEIFLRHIKGLAIAQKYEKADPSWFGVPFICADEELKRRLVAHLEQNGIQTRNYFAGNILVHPGYRFMDNWKDYPKANRVLKEVFFVGCSPTFTEKSFEHLDNVLQQFV